MSMLERHVEILDGLAGMIASSGSACGTCRNDDKHFSLRVSRNYFVPPLDFETKFIKHT